MPLFNPTTGGGLSDGDMGDITVSGGGTVLTIDAGVVTNAKHADMATKTYKGRTSSLTGVPEDVAVATVKTDLALVKADVGLGSVDNTSDAGKPVSTATQTALDLKANLASPTFTGTPSLPTGTTGVTQTAANSTTALATTAFATTADNLKANLASPTFTGTPSLPTGTTAVTQTAADSTTAIATTAFATTADNLKANLASPTFTGTVTMPGPTINDATDITISATTGTKIGQAGSKIGFYGVTPALRPGALTQTYSTTSTTHAAVTSTVMPAGGTGVAAGGWSTSANRDLAIAAFAADRTDLANLKNFVNSVVDQLQALGILQ